MRKWFSKLYAFFGRHDLSLPMVIGAYVIGFQSAIVSVMLRWSDPQGSYVAGWPVFAVVLTLFYRAYRQRRHRGEPSPWWLGLLAALSVLSCIALLTHTLMVLYILLVPMLFAALACFWSWARLKPFWLPLSLLGTVIPFWDYLGWPLARVTDAVVGRVLRVSGIDVHFAGWLVYLKDLGTFDIFDGTAGLRYLIPAMALSLFIAFWRFRRWRSRLSLLLLGFAGAVVANWVRVYLLVRNAGVPLGASVLWRHQDLLGWGLAAVGLAPVIVLAWRLGRRVRLSKTGVATTRPETSHLLRSPVARGYLVTLACLLCLLAPMVSAISASASPTRLAPVYLKGETDWHPSFAEIKNGWVPSLVHADNLSRQHWFVIDKASTTSLALPQEFVSAYIAIYQGRRLDDHLTEDVDRLYHGDQWQIDVPFLLEGKQRRYAGLILERKDSGRKVYVAMGFYVAGHWSVSADGAELNRIFSLTSGHPETALIAVGIDCGDCTDWKPRLRTAVDKISQHAIEELDR